MSQSTSTIVPGRFPMVRITWAGLPRPVHEGIAEQFRAVIAEWERQGGQRAYPIRSWWGYATRPNNAGGHPRGVAIDVNPAENPMVAKRTPCPSDMPRWFIDAWKAQGFGWGGDWRSKCDAMHFSKLPTEGGNGRIYEPAAGRPAPLPPVEQEDPDMNVTMTSIPPKGTTDPSGKELHRVTFSIDSPAQCENGWWTWLSVTPAGPAGRKSAFSVWIEGTHGQGWPGHVKDALGNRRYAWQVPKGTTMVHFENLDAQLPTGVTLATTRAP